MPRHGLPGYNPGERFLRQRSELFHIEEQDEGLVPVEQGLDMGNGKRPGTGELGILGELAGKLSVDVL